MNKVFKVLTSLRLTVVCLCFAIGLVFIGTLAQVDEGLYIAQNRYFRSLLIWWSPDNHFKLPVYPGGYLIGGILLANLIASHIVKFKYNKKKIGILLTHFGLILLFVGQFGTDLFSRESAMTLAVGETKNYSEAFRETELALIDTTSDPKNDHVYAIADTLLAKKKTIESSKLPLTVHVKNFWHNADVFPTPPIATNIPSGTILPQQVGADAGALAGLCVFPKPTVTDPDDRDFPAAVVEFLDGTKSLGTYLFWAGHQKSQTVEAGGNTYQTTLRLEREYYPFTLTLLDAAHDKYKGTEIPKNFSSRVRIDYPDKHEARETQIYMNNPLRFAGLTFFQHQMSDFELARQAGFTPTSTFQVVRNPSWLTPYLACVLVALGLIIQFMTHLIGFATKRRVTQTAADAKVQRGKDAKLSGTKSTREVTIS